MIIIGLVIPRFLLLNYGSETNGFLSSVTQIITYMSLLEAGVGTASLQALYKPVAEDNKKEISAILSATNHFYKRTGVIYLIVVIIISIIYPIVVSNTLGPVTIVSVILVNGLSGVIAYFFQGKYKILLQAEGKNYVIANLNTVTNVLVNVSRVILINMNVSIILVQSMYLVFNILQMLYFWYYMRKNYKWLNVKDKPNFEAISQKDAVLVYQISALIFEHTDVLILTLMCDLRVVSVYSLYKTLFGMVNTLLTNVSSGFVFRLGHAYNTGRSSFRLMYDAYETYYMSIVFSIHTVAYIFILPFLKLYTAGITDIEYIDSKLSLMFLIIGLLSCGRMTSANAINYAGKFKATQNRAVLESVINLAVTIVGTHFIGIYGALLGTIVALLYRTNDMIIYSAKHILKDSCFKTYKRWLCNVPVFAVIVVIWDKFSFEMNSYLSLLLIATIVSIIIFAIYLIVDSIMELQVCKVVIRYIVNIVKKKLFKQKGA